MKRFTVTKTIRAGGRGGDYKLLEIDPSPGMHDIVFLGFLDEPSISVARLGDTNSRVIREHERMVVSIS